MATITSSIAQTPALPPPPGKTSDFNSPATLKEAMNIAMGITIPLTTICFLLRTYVRSRIKRQKWICEDWLALAAFVSREESLSSGRGISGLTMQIGTIAFCGTGAATVAHHGGEHEWDMTKSQAKEAYYWFNVARILYGITICTAKLAILCLYRRVLSGYPRSPFDIIAIVLIALLTLFYVATTIVKICECVPRARAWDDSIPGNCIDTPMLLSVSGVFNVLTDFIMVMMPLRMVWNLNIKVTEKVHVMLAFTFGMCAPAFSLAGSIVKLRGHRNPDKTWIQLQMIMWALAELTTGILCVSFPELGVLLNGGIRRPRKQASTGIREGRYRDQDAVFNGERHRLWSCTTSLRATLSTVNTSNVVEPGVCHGSSKTMATSSEDGGGGGGRHEHVEHVEVELEVIDRPMTALIIDNGRLVKQAPERSTGEVEAAGEMRVDSNMV